jgi:hypothetical protein
LVCALLLAGLAAGQASAGYVCEYANSEGTGNDASTNTVGIAVLSEDNFVLDMNRDDLPTFALCKWTAATCTTGRGNDVLQWFYNFDTVNLENPFGMAVDDYGYVYVCNNDPDHNILVFDGTPPDPAALPYRLATYAGDTLCAIDVDDQGRVFVATCNAQQDRVEIYPSILDDQWINHDGEILRTISLPDGLYYGMCVSGDGTEVYVSEYYSAMIHRYTGSPSAGYTLDTGFSVQVDSVATAIDIDDQGYLYVVSDHWRERTYDYSQFWVVDLASGAVTDKVDMYWEGGGDVYGASETSAGYYSAVDIEVDEAGNVYVVHDYAWAVEKWVGEPSTGVEAVHSGGDLPRTSILVHNHPNPFNASTEIRYRLPAEARVRLDVYNVAGQRVERLIDGRRTAGEHRATWNPAGLPSGIYFIRLQAGARTATAKAALVR